MKETVYYNDKDLLAKLVLIQWLEKNGNEMLVEHIPLAQSYN